MPDREVKLGEILSSLIDRGPYRRNRQSILDSVGVSAAALSQYARDQTRPSFAKLVALADFFGVSLDYLVFGTPSGALVDESPTARYVDTALADVQARARRHSDLMARIGRVLADRVDAVAHELAESPTAGREGLIQHDEVLRVETHCLQADIVTLDLGFDLVELKPGDVAAGRFLQAVAANIAQGVTYRFLLPGDYAGGAEGVSAFRSLLAQHVSGDQLQRYCAFRLARQQLLAELGLYRLNIASLELEEPAIFAQFDAYIDEENRLGYLTRPNADSAADMLMDASHTGRACDTFEVLWADGRSV